MNCKGTPNAQTEDLFIKQSVLIFDFQCNNYSKQWEYYVPTYYAGIMLDAFAHLLYAQNYAAIIGTSLH